MHHIGNVGQNRMYCLLQCYGLYEVPKDTEYGHDRTFDEVRRNDYIQKHNQLSDNTDISRNRLTHNFILKEDMNARILECDPDSAYCRWRLSRILFRWQ